MHIDLCHCTRLASLIAVSAVWQVTASGSGTCGAASGASILANEARVACLKLVWNGDGSSAGAGDEAHGHDEDGLELPGDTIRTCHRRVIEQSR